MSEETPMDEEPVVERIRRMTTNPDGSRFIPGQPGNSSGVCSTDQKAGMEAVYCGVKRALRDKGYDEPWVASCATYNTGKKGPTL